MDDIQTESESKHEAASKRSKVMKGWWKEWVKSCSGGSLFKRPAFHQCNYWRHLTAFILKWLNSLWSCERGRRREGWGGGVGQGGASLCRTLGMMEAVQEVTPEWGMKTKKKIKKMHMDKAACACTRWKRSKALWHHFNNSTAMDMFLSYCFTRLCLLICT